VRYRRLHRWDVTPKEALEIQNRLRAKLDLGREPVVVETVAGIDVSYALGSDRLYSAIVVVHLPELATIDTATAAGRVTFPYVPGLLSFREAPVVIKAWERLSLRPDCLVCDGQGLAHPRRFGLACHLGLVLDTPSLGCAKSLLVGEYRMPAGARGSSEPLWHQGEQVGLVLRTRAGVAPVFVSQGYRISLDKAAELVMSCCLRYRLPEPVRRAHLLVNEVRRGHVPAPGRRGARAPRS